MECLPFPRSQQQPHGRGCGKEKNQRHDDTEQQQDLKAPPKACLYALPVSGTVALCDKDRGRGRAAVTKGIGKTFDPSGRRVGRDQVKPLGIDGSLHQKLPEVDTALVKRCDKAQGKRSPDTRQVRLEIFPVYEKSTFLTHKPGDTHPGGHKLRKHGRQRRTDHAHVKAADQQQIKPEVEQHRNRQRCRRNTRLPDRAQKACIEVI